ncbi:MAG: tetratricopeptide repeat protein [Bacteroidota bacterium]
MEEITQLIDTGKYNEALAMLNELLLANEYDLQAMSLKATVLLKLNQHQESISIYSSLINLIPNDPDNYAGRGLAYHYAGEKSMALTDFDKAIALNPDNGYRYSSRAFIRDYYGDSEGALNDYNKAITLDPEDAISLNNIGVIQEKLGQINEARQNFDKADEITGVDLKSLQIPTIPETKTDDKAKPAQTSESGISHFFTTLKGLLTSPDERRNFYRFLFRK